jgi:hypothetical protein
MSFNTFEDRKPKEDIAGAPKPCTRCFRLSKHEDLMQYGSFCKACYDVYCYDAPAYPLELNKYLGNPKGWAKRIIDKHNAGIPVARISLEFAQQALS